MNDDEEYIYFGTPLPEIEDETVLKKKAAKELQVRDERGRQRFHGAFTGGFSAGYFNTVGTKEGWSPSTFISSREKVSERIQQNPEDFMDDEDFGEFGIATRKIHTTSNFQDPSNSRSKRKLLDSDSVIPGEAPLNDIVQPVRESIGIVILNKLGWRFGQGIGPRVKKHSGTKVYGCSLFPDSIANEEDDSMLTAFTFAPKDTEGISFKSKDNCFGLGYTGLSKQSVLHVPSDPYAPTKTKSWLAKDKKKIAISGQAFGVGAFEDDDEDIYGKDDMSQYDFSSLMAETPEDKQKGGSSTKFGNFQDMLEGFHLASQQYLGKKNYPAPILPPNFKPVHLKFVLSKQVDVKVSQSRHSLTAFGRSLIIGEKKFHKVPAASVEEKIANVISETAISASSSTSLNFWPFPNDPAKQIRYEEYLKLKNTGDISKFVQPSSMTEWEKQQEIEEFAKAVVLFKPLSSALSSRFESRSHLGVEHEVMLALENIKKKEEKVVPVKRNLIGTSNRIVQEWHPVSLLCKRMNVPNPYLDSSLCETRSVLKSKSVFDHLSFTNKSIHSNPKIKEVYETPLTTSSISQKGQDSSSFEKSSNDLLIENKRPPIDFFKDIFENSSSDEDGDTPKEKDENVKELGSGKKALSPNNLDNKIQNNINSLQISHHLEVNQINEKSLFIDSKSNSKSVEKKKIGFGVFANLDMDALNQRRPTEKPLQQNTSETKNEKAEIDFTSESNNVNSVNAKETFKHNDLYGPELPPNFLNSSVSSSNSTITSSKKYPKHKSKHKRHKHKKKKKKKSSKRDSSSSDSSSEPDDIPPSLIIEKMIKLQKSQM